MKSGTLKPVLTVGSEGNEPTPSERGASEKLRLLLESRTLTEDQKGDWLRRHGMHSEHLTLWEQELEDIVTDKQQKLKQEISELKKENKELKKELARNQAAMFQQASLTNDWSAFEGYVEGAYDSSGDFFKLHGRNGRVMFEFEEKN